MTPGPQSSHETGSHRLAFSQFLRFSLSDQTCAVPIDTVREILEVAPTTALPMMPAFVRGVMNLRGSVVPVIDLAARYGMPVTQLARRTCVIVVEVRPVNPERGATQVLGVLVDTVHEVLEADSDAIEVAPALGTRIAPQFIAGIARSRGQLVTVLDLPRSLDDDELAQLIAAEIQH